MSSDRSPELRTVIEGKSRLRLAREVADTTPFGTGVPAARLRTPSLSEQRRRKHLSLVSPWTLPGTPMFSA